MVSYTLLDFGSREAGIQIAKAGLVAADFLFNNAHRQIIYGVTAAYYRLNSALAQEDAALAALTNAQTVQSAAEARLNNGLATLPDVLEARAATAQASYELETIRGAERLAHGQLAEALGVRPTASIQVQNLQALEMPVISDSADGFIKRALERRPDLLAEVTQLKAADAGIRAARSRYYPQVAFSGSADYEYLHGYQPPGPAASIDGETWLAKLSATWTLFDGGARYNDLDRARSERRQAQEEVNAAADRIEDEVWAAYSNVETSLHRQEAARALLTASEQSYNAVLEAYKYGVKNFLDVVSAQRTLAQARTEQVQSQAEVLTSFAQLAFASGDLAPSPKP
jgi:outer membrane protein TolC